MTRFTSRISPTSSVFQENRADMLALVDRMQELLSRAPKISEARKDRFAKRGQLTPRDRLNHLLDPGAPYLSIGNMAGYIMDGAAEPKSIPGSTMMAGIGYVAGTRVVIVTDDSGIKAGAMTGPGVYRLLRAQAIALEQKLPFLHLVESGGGDLMNYRVEGFVQGGEMFANLAKLSAAGIPVISILHGSSTAGGAYMPGLSDYVVAVKGRGRAFLAGPPLLKAATGEIADEESLGGAEMHASVSGVADYLAGDDGEAVNLVREIVKRLDWDKRLGARAPQLDDLEPYYDPDELAGVVPVDYRTPYDVRELVARVVDRSDMLDFKSRYGVSTVCMNASIMGVEVGLIGNNGPIDPEGATKAAQFIQLMDQAGTPIIFLQNTTGYLVGTAPERAGIIKHGSKMIQAVTNARVPRMTVNVGASFGAGNYGMCGRAYGPDFLFTWPNARMGVMGGDQAAKTMGIVAEAKAKAAGQELDPSFMAAQADHLTKHFDGQSDAFHCSGHCLDDGMIDPRDTRRTLGFLLQTVVEARARTVAPSSFGVARL